MGTQSVATMLKMSVAQQVAGTAVAEVHRVFTAMSTRLLAAFAEGPVGNKHPAVDNLAQLGVPGATPTPVTPYMPPALVS